MTLITCTLLDILAEPLVTAMAQKEANINNTVSFIRLEVYGFFFDNVNRFLQIGLELLNVDKAIMAAVVVKTVLTVLLDVIFLSELSFSLRLGVNGVAISNIVSEASRRPHSRWNPWTTQSD